MIKKIDLKNEKYLLFIDTETIGTINNIESVMPFEIGAKVYDTESKRVVKQKSYLIRKFINNKYVMMSTFSANKYPKYLELIETDKRYNTYSANEISKDLKEIINKYNIKVMVAHNGAFDKDAIARLFEEFGVLNPLKKVDLLDTMEISKIITFSKDYSKFCINNKSCLNDMRESKFITNSGRVRTTAQAIYCYITNDTKFEEKHTGLEDIDIEIEIFRKSAEMLGNTMINLNTAPNWRDYSIVIEED